MITVNAQNYVENGTTNTNTVTIPITIASGSDRILIVGIPISQAVTPSSVTFAGSAMTLLTSKTGTDNAKAYLYYTLNPAVGAANVVITYSASLQYLIGGAICFNGVDQTTPYANATSANNTAQNKSFSVTCSKTTSYILECLGSGSGAHTAQSGQTVWLPSFNRICGYDSGVVAGTNTQNWNCDTSAPYAWVGCELLANVSSGNFFKFM